VIGETPFSPKFPAPANKPFGGRPLPITACEIFPRIPSSLFPYLTPCRALDLSTRGSQSNAVLAVGFAETGTLGPKLFRDDAFSLFRGNIVLRGHAAFLDRGKQKPLTGELVLSLVLTPRRSLFLLLI